MYLSQWFCTTWVTTLAMSYSYFRVAEASTRIFQPFNFTVDIFVETQTLSASTYSTPILITWSEHRSAVDSIPALVLRPPLSSVIFLLLLFIPSSWVRPEIRCHLFFSLPLIYFVLSLYALLGPNMLFAKSPLKESRLGVGWGSFVLYVQPVYL